MSFPLQNQPGSRSLPVNLLLELFRKDGNYIPLGFILYLFPAGVAVFTIFIGLDMTGGVTDLLRRAEGDPIAAIALIDAASAKALLILLVAPLVVLVLIGMHFAWVLRKPIREQRRYYRLSGKQKPTERELRALRIAGVWNYEKEWWPFSLEYWPMEKYVPVKQRDRFDTLELFTAEGAHEQMLEEWGIPDDIVFRETLDEYLERGIHSERFVHEMWFSAPEVAKRLSALALVSEEAIMESYAVRVGRPPKLLWAFDLARAHHLIRTGFMAEYIDAPTAWNYLERITDYTVAIFETEAEFVENLKIGRAYWMGTGDEEHAIYRAKVVDAYLPSSWPRKLGPWPNQSGRILPPQMSSGFAYLRQ